MTDRDKARYELEEKFNKGLLEESYTESGDTIYRDISTGILYDVDGQIIEETSEY